MKVHLRSSPLDTEAKILDLEGRIDDYTYTNLEEEIRALLNIGSNKIVCNFNLVEYIGAAGLQAFFELIKQARNSGGDIKLCCLPSYVHKKFVFAGFAEICPFYQEPDDAIQEWLEQQKLAQEQGAGGEKHPDQSDPYGKTDVIHLNEVMAPKNEEELRAPTVQMAPAAVLASLSGDTDAKTPASAIESEAASGLREKTIKISRDDEETKDLSPAIGALRPETHRKISHEVEQTLYTRIATLRQNEVQQSNSEQQTKCFAYNVTYCIHEKLSDGFWGKTYRGEEKSCYGFSRPVILKYIRNEYAQDREKMNFLMRELRKTFGIQHQSLVTVHKLARWDNYYFVVMEHVNGVNLEQASQRPGKGKRLFPPAIACYIVYQLCNAMAYANRRADEEGTQVEIIHGKICTDNIIISKEYDVKLLNLGLSKVDVLFHMQQPGAWKKMKNLAYLAPEVLASGMPSKSGDIFALGVVFYQLLTGQLPFSVDQIASQYLGLPLPPSHFQPKINDILDKLVVRCLLPEPERRFQDFQDLALQLEEMLYEKGMCFIQALFAKFWDNSGLFGDK